MTNETDYVADIMNKWYEAMQQNKIMVQPKASTILGIILADYVLTPNVHKRNIWEEALSIKGGEFAGWYAELTNAEKVEYDEGRTAASQTFDPRHSKQLLKG